jgi:hypothetical protein
MKLSNNLSGPWSAAEAYTPTRPNQWIPFVLDISSIAANQATVYIKFTMGPTNSSGRFSGWNIDDFQVTSEAIYPSEGTMGTELEITGSNFGTKKGKVYLGYEVNGKLTKKSCTVVSWTVDPATEEGDIVFVVPKGLATGPYDLIITNSVGSSLPAVFTVN